MGTYWEKLHGAVNKNYHDEEMREKGGLTPESQSDRSASASKEKATIVI